MCEVVPTSEDLKQSLKLIKKWIITEKHLPQKIGNLCRKFVLFLCMFVRMAYNN